MIIYFEGCKQLHTYPTYEKHVLCYIACEKEDSGEKTHAIAYDRDILI